MWQSIGIPTGCGIGIHPERIGTFSQVFGKLLPLLPGAPAQHFLDHRHQFLILGKVVLAFSQCTDIRHWMVTPLSSPNPIYTSLLVRCITTSITEHELSSHQGTCRFSTHTRQTCSNSHQVH